MKIALVYRFDGDKWLLLSRILGVDMSPEFRSWVTRSKSLQLRWV